MMSKSKLKSVARSMLTEAEYSDFKTAFKSFQSSKSVDDLCSNVVPFANTTERLQLLAQVRQNIPNNLRAEFTNKCRSLLKESRRNLRKRDSTQENEFQLNQNQSKSKKSDVKPADCDRQQDVINNRETEEVEQDEDAKRHWLKVSYKERNITLVRESVNSKFGFAIRGGKDQAGSIFVSDVEPRSIADIQRLQVGDRIARINELDCKRAKHRDAVHVIRSENCLHMKVLTQVVERELQDRNDIALKNNGENLRKVTVRPDENGWLGCSIRGGVDYDCEVSVISIEESSPAESASLKIGDVIVKVDGCNITGLTHVQIVRLIVVAGTQITFTVKTPEPCESQGGSRTRRSQSVSSATNRAGDNVQRRQSHSQSNGMPPPTPLWVQCSRNNSVDRTSATARALDFQATRESVPLLHAQLPSYSAIPCFTALENQRLSPPPPYSEEVPSEHQVLARGIAVDNVDGLAPSGNVPLNQSSSTCSHLSTGHGPSTRHGPMTRHGPSSHLEHSTRQEPTSGQPSMNGQVQIPGQSPHTLHGPIPGHELSTCHISSNRDTSNSEQASVNSPMPLAGHIPSTRQPPAASEAPLTGRAPLTGQASSTQASLTAYELSTGMRNPRNNGLVEEDIPTTNIDIDENFLDCENNYLPLSSERYPDVPEMPHLEHGDKSLSTQHCSLQTSYLDLSPCRTPSDKGGTPQQMMDYPDVNYESNRLEHLQDLPGQLPSFPGPSGHQRSRSLPDEILETNIDMGNSNHSCSDQSLSSNLREAHSNSTLDNSTDYTQNHKKLHKNLINSSHCMQDEKYSQPEEKMYTRIKPPQYTDSVLNQIAQFDKKNLKGKGNINRPFLRSESDKYGRTFCYELTFDDVEVKMLNEDRDDTAPLDDDLRQCDGPDLLHALNRALEERAKGMHCSFDSDDSEYEWEV